MFGFHRSVRLPADACARCRLPFDAQHRTEDVRPKLKRHSQDPAKASNQILTYYG